MHRLYYSVIGVFFKFQLIVCLKKKKKTRAVVWIQVEWLQTCSYKYKLFWVNLVLHLHVQTSDIRGFLCPCWVEVKLLLRKWTVQYSIYLESGTLTIRPNSHTMIDPKTQHKREKTRNPAKIVRNGGPWASSLDIVPPDFSSLESPSEGLEFEANTVYNLVLDCNLAAFLNLDPKEIKILDIKCKGIGLSNSTQVLHQQMCTRTCKTNISFEKATSIRYQVLDTIRTVC